MRLKQRRENAAKRKAAFDAMSDSEKTAMRLLRKAEYDKAQAPR